MCHEEYIFLVILSILVSEGSPSRSLFRYNLQIRLGASKEYPCFHGEVRKIFITKTRLYNFDPLKPHFYIAKLGFTGVYIIFLLLLKSIDYGYSLELPRRGGSNGYPKSMFWTEIWIISEFFHLKIFSFLVVKFSIYLNRRVFVMYMIPLT